MEHQTTDLASPMAISNTLMLTGGMANRDIRATKLLAARRSWMRGIIRGDAVVGLYGGSDYAAALDELDQIALTGEAVKQIREGADGQVLTVLVPLKASSGLGGTDCIRGCHAFRQMDEVLGAVRVD